MYKKRKLQRVGCLKKNKQLKKRRYKKRKENYNKPVVLKGPFTNTLHRNMPTLKATVERCFNLCRVQSRKINGNDLAV